MSAFRPIWALGLMSGTSCDGVDAALIETDGEGIARLGPGLSLPYPPAFRAKLRAALGDAAGGQALADELTAFHLQAVRQLLATWDARCPVALIGFHGQTILHEPALGRTLQIGDAASLARDSGIDTVADFRSADMRAGGQGAPLAPLYHAALARALDHPIAVLNIGGVANVTWIGAAAETLAGSQILAFDTGPGNAPIDDWASRHLGRPVDRDGALAAAGQVAGSVLAELLSAPYFQAPAPKSLDRNGFDLTAVDKLSAADGAATLTAFSAAAVALGAKHFPAPARRWLVCGGGRHNPTLMRELTTRLGCPVEPCEAVGWQGDLLEAQAFGFLAVRSRRGLPLSLPGTTGAKAPTSGGAFFAATVRRL